MHAIRKKYGYWDEIHYREIKGAKGSAQFLVAQHLIKTYICSAIKGCPFKAFIAEDGVNRAFPYPGDDGYPEHLLLSTKAAFKGGIAWSFFKESKVRLNIVYDDTDNELEREVARDLRDLLQTEINTRRLDSPARYPWIRVSPVHFVSSDPKEVEFDDWISSEFIQLTDLLLGACVDALEVLPPPKGQGRRRLSKSIMAVLAETLQVPWLQQVPVHRTFSVSLYPDEHNFAYPAALRKAQPAAPIGEYLRLPGFGTESA